MPGKLDEAFQKFIAALCHDSGSFAAYQGISYVFYLKGRPDKAIESVNKAIKLNPEAYYLYLSRAVYKAALEKPPMDEVCDDYCLAFRKSPCKKDFDFSKLLEAAKASGRSREIAGLLWSGINDLPRSEDILDFYISLLSEAEDEWLNRGLPAGYRVPTGRILFHELIASCKCETIKKIHIDKNLLSRVNGCGLTPLGVAVKAGKIDTGAYLLSVGSSADERIAAPWMTPFAMAVVSNKKDWVKLFLESGADVDHPLKNKGSYLALACSLKHWEIAQMLLEHGADPNHPGLTGDMQPLRFCDPSENADTVELLLAKGAKLEYPRFLGAEDLRKKRSEKLKNVLTENSADRETFNDFFAHLCVEGISAEESGLIQGATQAKPDFSHDENNRFAMLMARSCRSVVTWPEEDAYPLAELPPAPTETEENVTPEKSADAEAQRQGGKKNEKKKKKRMSNLFTIGLSISIVVILLLVSIGIILIFKGAGFFAGPLFLLLFFALNAMRGSSR